MCADGTYLAAVHDHDTIRVLYRTRALGDDNLGGLGYETFEACADELVGLGVDGTRGVIEDEYLGFLEQCPGDAEPLLLTARDVGASLLDVGVIPVGHALDELVGLGKLAGFDELLVARIGVAPAQVLLDGAREEDVSLQDDGNLVAQGVEVVPAYVIATDSHGALGYVVEAADELDER